ncbi:MAG: carbohydrate ABC transporter permease [Clostridiales bacterium]|nr:carbohydrate ABC transporter permease [Roseburia sp.]MDD7636724.1 carbohydrate ABC transporter permease [Clostridiales bacterium]MDY4111705.1 carbohydrate ABC transporter permease [Roseburia sp.]
MNRKAKNRLGDVGFYIISIVIAVIVMIPFFWMLSTSLKSKGALMALPVQWIPEEPTRDAYAQVFKRFPFLRAVGNSIFITVSYVLITILSSSMAAFAFTKIQFPFADGIFKLYLASMMIPTQVTLIPLFIIMNGMSLTDTYASVICPSLFKAFGIFLLVQNMRSVPNDFIEAAQIDGAGMWYIYRKIMLPLSAPAIATLGITTFMDSWNDYLWPLVMLSDKNKMTITLALNSLNGQYATEYNVLMAGSLISMIPIIIVYIGANSRMKSGIMVGGVKG